MHKVLVEKLCDVIENISRPNTEGNNLLGVLYYPSCIPRSIQKFESFALYGDY